MSELKSTTDDITQVVAELGPGPLAQRSVVRHVHPLFSRVLQYPGIYLSNHSLGRPLDQMAIDVQQGLARWYQDINGAWGDWLAEIQAFRKRVARLISAPRPDCIVPKSSAGQGLRTILNCFDGQLGVLTTQAEFSSVDHILKVYAQRGRIRLRHVSPDAQGWYHEAEIAKASDSSTDLVVVSLVLFNTGQWLTKLARLISDVQAKGTKVLVDLYHAVGTLPVNIQELGADFAIGGCYKYLRGGPGACWLYIHPQYLNGTFQSLDTGWFAQPQPFEFSRPNSPSFAKGGDAFLESTPPILPYYQARAGLTFTLAVGVERLRAYSLIQQSRLAELLAQHQIPMVGEVESRGAFMVVPHSSAETIASELRNQQVIVDARDGLLRLCPDILTTDDELVEAVEKISKLM